MVDYATMKAALTQKCPGEKRLAMNFTKEVYNTFLAEKEQSFQHYLACGEWGELTQSEQSSFYKENGGAWCVMLEIYNSSLPEWRVDICEAETLSFNAIGRAYVRFETKEQAQQWAKAAYPNYLCEIYEVHGSAEQPDISHSENEYEEER